MTTSQSTIFMQREAWEDKNVYDDDDDEDDEGDKDDTEDDTEVDTDHEATIKTTKTMMKMISKERRGRAEGRSSIFLSNVSPVIK